MGRKNLSPESDWELNDFIAQYEAMKAENKHQYMDADQLADIADKYAADLRFSEAQEVITYGLSLHPGNTDLLIEQAYLHLDMHNPNLAKEVADSIAETFPTEVKLLKAELLLNEGLLDAAEILLDTIEDKEDPSTIIEISYLYLDMGYPEKALPWLKQIISSDSEDEEYLAALADCYSAMDMLEEAVTYYNKLIDINPYSSPYWLGLSKCYFTDQDYNKALEAIDFALTADETFGEGHTMKAHCLFHLSNEEEAIEEYLKALKYKALGPEFTYMFIGLAYSNKEQWQQANESYTKAIQAIGEESSPLLTDIYCNNAICLGKLGRNEEAHQCCALAKESSPQDVEPYLVEGRLYMNEDNPGSANKEWQWALQQAPEADTWYQIGTYSMESNMPENARICFEHVQQLDPDFENINEQLAAICMILKDRKGFSKYNQLCGNPLDFKSLLDSFEKIKSSRNDLLDELREFLTTLEKDDDEVDENNEEKESGKSDKDDKDDEKENR